MYYYYGIKIMDLEMKSLIMKFCINRSNLLLMPYFVRNNESQRVLKIISSLDYTTQKNDALTIHISNKTRKREISTLINYWIKKSDTFSLLLKDGKYAMDIIEKLSNCVKLVKKDEGVVNNHVHYEYLGLLNESVSRYLCSDLFIESFLNDSSDNIIKFFDVKSKVNRLTLTKNKICCLKENESVLPNNLFSIETIEEDAYSSEVLEVKINSRNENKLFDYFDNENILTVNGGYSGVREVVLSLNNREIFYLSINSGEIIVCLSEGELNELKKKHGIVLDDSLLQDKTQKHDRIKDNISVYQRILKAEVSSIL